MSDLKLTKSRQYLLLVIGVFLVPVILAKLALDNRWFDYGVTNQGELVNNHLTLADLGLKADEFNHKWLMLVNLPEQCDDLCESTLLTINNAYVLLGKEIPRVLPVALTQTAITDKMRQSMHHSKWQSQTLPEKAKQNLDKPQLIIIDPLSNVVLSYKLPTEAENVSQLGNAIIADMKKLLKYSRIG
ncbi:hypothetical protein [Thalassotalea profundi]|uniref:Cytochrome oxidase assembly protein n=1 Tax=Thalassotalea profundi TaxID=2036687 RepID=A0ABQ3IYB5_9GAMM|nr:hypothetical protein [Thalassotalea profundi]GHE96913.1 hypothetical protein GCM10011501_28030 [Thalassotalea profundi]